MEKTSVLVLIAEDEAEIRNILQDTFEEGGFDVFLVATGEEAISALDGQGENLRAVVTDIRLGGDVTGWDVARHARQLRPDMPVVYMTGTEGADWAALGPDAFRARLAEHDPVLVDRLKPGDRQRHVRAWEVWRATGRPLSAWQEGEASAAPWRFVTILLAPDRAWLRDRIERRFDVMLGEGVVAEVRAVFDRQPDPIWPGLKAHGAPELFRHFRGEMSLEDVRRVAIDHTRQYAKRQMTWFRHQMTPDLVLDPRADQALGTIEKYLDNPDT